MLRRFESSRKVLEKETPVKRREEVCFFQIGKGVYRLRKRGVYYLVKESGSLHSTVNQAEILGKDGPFLSGRRRLGRKVISFSSPENRAYGEKGGPEEVDSKGGGGEGSLSSNWG